MRSHLGKAGVKRCQRVLSTESNVCKGLVVEKQGPACLRSLSDFLCAYMDSEPKPRGRGGIKSQFGSI